jgi:enterobactin synthetase component D
MITENPFRLPGLYWCEGLISGVAIDPAQLPETLRAAVPKRQNEFLAGRLCAAQALRAAGLPETVGQKNRAPVWPLGCVGSISHSDRRVVAVVSRNHSGLGVDIETLMTQAQATDIQALILTEAETALRPETMSLGPFLTLIFSAKESLYKALSAHLPQMPGFLDVTVLALTSDALTLRLGDRTLTARYVLTTEDVLTLVCVA